MSQATIASAPAVATKTPAEIEIAAVAKAELGLVTKYGSKIVTGSVRRAPEGSKYGQKMLVTIYTKGIDGEFDGSVREIASSDVFQVHHTPEVAAELKKARSADKRAAASADRAAEVEVAAVDLDAIEASL
jgi:hypothetical protein